MRLAIILLALVSVGISSHAQTVTKNSLQSTPAIQPHEKVHWIDLDGDADPDLVAFYSNPYNSAQSYVKIFKNQGGILTEETNALGGTQLQPGSYTFGDYDADGDIDIAIIDYQTLKILINNGNFVFDVSDTLLTNNNTWSSIYWIDIDGDVDLDIAFDDLLYINVQGSYALGLYKLPIATANRTWIDLNNDGLQDMIATQGQTAGVNPLYLFLNEGNGKFARKALLSHAYSDFGFLILRDFDLDGDIDITLSEIENKVTVLKNKFTETGELSFLWERSLLTLGSSRATAADLNHDGLTDLILNGQEYPYRYTYLYTNASTSDSIRFSKKSIPLQSSSTTSFCLLDVDGDKSLELYINGWEDSYSTPLSHLVSIDFTGTDPTLAKPVNLVTDVKNEVNLSWSYQGTNSDITFNIELKRNGTLYSPSHVSGNGTLLSIGSNNFANERNTILHNLPAGNYQWRVQVVSPSFQTSDFSDSQSFTILPAPTAVTLTAAAYNKVQLNWAHSGAASAFAVFRNSDNYALEEIAVIPSSQLAYVDDKIPANEHFEYYIKAKDGDTYSDRSNVVTHYSGQFTEVEFGRDQPNIIGAKGASADFDNDGDYDLGFTGRIDFDFGNSVKLTNDGLGNFVPGEFLPTADWGEGYLEKIVRDMDNDGDMDIVAHTGANYTSQRIKVMRNDNGVFSSAFETEPFLGIWQVGVEDFNRDGRMDIIYSHTAGNSSGDPISNKLLLQKADKTFEQSLFQFFPERAENPGRFALIDVNHDQFTDILFCGTEYKKPSLFINDRGMTFTLTPFESPAINSFAFADLNGDGKLDLAKVIDGSTLQTYVGDGSLNFVNPKEMNFGLVSFNAAVNISLGDVDMDGLPDLILTDEYRTYLLLNRGDFNFIHARYDFAGNWGTSLFLTDVERDGDIDLVKMGNDSYHQGLNFFYLNNSNIPNAAPTIPAGIVSSQKGSEIILQWQASSDDHSIAGFLSYNVELRKQGGEYLVHPETDASGTFRKRLGPGNAGHNTKFIMTELPPGNYTARVQALDASFKLSAWSTSYAFTVHQGPTNLALQRILLDKIRLTWTGAPAVETKVIVERKSVDSEFEVIAELSPGSTQYVDDGIAFNKVYTYRVYEQLSSAATASSNYVSWNSSLFQVGETTLTNVFGSLEVADYNLDGNMDLLVNGGRIFNSTTIDITKALYKYTPGGWVKQPVGSSVLGHTGSLYFVDLNGDHLPDIWEHGYIFNQGLYQTEVFSNTGNDTFVPTENILTYGDYQLIKQLDLNNDNAPDYFAVPNNNTTYSDIFLSNFDGTIAPAKNPFPECEYSCNLVLVPADFDNDGDEDFFRYTSGGFELWINEKGKPEPTGLLLSDIFGPVNGVPILQAVDYNGDNFPDLLLEADSYNDSNAATALVKNLGPDENGDLHFQKISLDLPKGDINANWADYDHDGDLDAFLVSAPCRMLLNEGNDTFSSYAIPGFFASLNNCKHVDFDDDGDLDIYISGYIQLGDLAGYDVPQSFVMYNQLIHNGTGTSNLAPVPPSNLRFHQDLSGVHLNWDDPSDDHTPKKGLTYDVVLYKGDKEYLRAPVDPSTGRRYKLALGNAPSTLLLNNLPTGDYTWKVQAIDQSFAGSDFSAAGSLTVLPDAPSINDTVIYRCGREISLTAEGDNIEWFSDEALTNKIASGDFHPQSSQVVYVTQTIDGLKGIARKVSITIYDRPEKPVITSQNPYTYCESFSGYQIYLSAQGTDLRWYSNATLTSLRGTGNLIGITAVNQTLYVTQKIGGCESLPQEITITPIEINSDIQYGDGTLTVAEENGSHYQWYKNGVAIIGADSRSLTVIEFATYLVVVHKNAVCYETSAPFVITGIEETNNYFNIYPNPSDDRFVVEVPAGVSQIEIHDSFGRLVYSAQIEGDEVDIESSTWSRGVYLISLMHNNTRHIRKLIVN